MAVQIFEYKNYKQYINDRLDEIDGEGRGARSRFSESIGCQSAYTAQVLRGTAHFNQEQGEEINQFFGHSDYESVYFLLILQFSRAGTTKLKSRLNAQIETALKARLQIKNRIESTAELEEHHRTIYYSSWLYGAIHALVSIPGFQTPERIAERLHLDIKNTREAIEFLVTSGLLIRDQKNNLKIGKGQIHLEAESPLIAKHHTNWRLHALKFLDQSKEDDMHYSSVISVSKADYALIREKLMKTIADIKPVIKKSKEEELASFCLDFYRF